MHCLKRKSTLGLTALLVVMGALHTGTALAARGDITTVAGIADTTGYVDHASTNYLTTDSSGNVYYAANYAIYQLASDGSVTIVVGTGVGGYSGDGGAATSAQIDRVNGLTIDAVGNLYLSDNLYHVVRKVDANTGIITTVAGSTQGFSGDGGPATSAKLSYPRGLATDSSGNLFISDTYNNRIRMVDSGGVITTVAGTGAAGYSGDDGAATAAQLDYPMDVAVDSADNLLVLDASNYAVRRVDGGGIITTVAGDGNWGYAGDGGLATAAELAGPNSITIDSADNLYIADSFNYRVRKVDTSGIITTVAGDGVEGYAGDNAAATAAQLDTPNGVAVDGSGNLFIADTNNFRIRKVDGSGTITSVAKEVKGYNGDNIPANSATLYNPVGVAADGNGNLYIADSTNKRVRKVDGGGTITTVAGDGSSLLSGNCDGLSPTATGFIPVDAINDNAGNLYFIGNNHQVCKIDSTGNMTRIAGITTTGFSGDNGQATQARLNTSQSLALDSLGNLYIADSVNYRVRKVDASTGIITTVAGNGTNADSGDGGAAIDASFRFPGGIALDSSDRLYIADANANRIRRVDGDGIITTIAGTGIGGYAGDDGPATSAELNRPYGIAIDEVGNLFIADSNNERVRMVNTSGNIVTIAGDGSRGFSGDNGPATAAQLYSPQDVAVDNQGNLYIADSSNQRIRKVELPDVYPPVITLLGDSPAAVALDATYVDPGSTVVDDTDSDIVVDVTGTVDTATPGAYTLSYSATDSAGNVGHATRLVYVADQTSPVIALLGDDPMQVSFGGTFNDPGTTVSDNMESGLTTHVSGSVNTNAVGDYLLTYDASDSSGNAAISVTRTVQVVDTTAPSISLNGDAYPEIEAGDSFVDDGVSVSDNVDSSPTVTVTGTVDMTTTGSYTLDYYATDSSGNVSATVHRYVDVIDTTAPVITLLGDDPLTLTVGDSFVDPGATVSDNADASALVVTVTGSVDTSSVGSYILNYNVSDASGNDATPVTRTVTVVAATASAVTSGGGGGGALGWFSLLLAGLGLYRRRR